MKGTRAMTITITKDEVLKRLNERLAMATAEDIRATNQHRMDEAAALDAYRDKLRKRLTMTWKEVKKADGIYLNAPSCPRLQAPDISRVIQGVKLDNRKAPYRLAQNSDIYAAMTWLPESKRPKKTVCDD